MPTEKEQMIAGEFYDPMDDQLVEEREAARRLTRLLNATDEREYARRVALLEELFGDVGEGSYLEPPFYCDYGYNVAVGERFFANFDCVFLDVCPIELGDRCMLGPAVHAYTASHPLDAEERAAGEEFGKPITVGDDVWIGGQAVINPGVTIGDEAVVAAGAVVIDDVPPGVFVGGNPAEVIREV